MHTYGERALLLLAVLCCCVGLLRGQGVPWYEQVRTQSFSGHNSSLIGIITEQHSWTLRWHCTTPSLLTLQINSDDATFLHTVQCTSIPSSTEITMTGTLYLAISGQGTWTLQATNTSAPADEVGR